MHNIKIVSVNCKSCGKKLQALNKSLYGTHNTCSKCVEPAVEKSMIKKMAEAIFGGMK